MLSCFWTTTMLLQMVVLPMWAILNLLYWILIIILYINILAKGHIKALSASEADTENWNDPWLRILSRRQRKQMQKGRVTNAGTGLNKIWNTACTRRMCRNLPLKKKPPSIWHLDVKFNCYGNFVLSWNKKIAIIRFSFEINVIIMTSFPGLIQSDRKLRIF